MQNKALLIDGNAIFCHGVQRLLESHDMEVVATTNNGDEGIKLAKQHAPQIILLDSDIRTSPTDELATLKQLRITQPHIKIVLFTWQTNSNQLSHVLQAGGHGYLARNIQPANLIGVIQDILRGQTVVPTELTPVLTRFRQSQNGEGATNAPSDLIAQLTPREYETLTHLVNGLNNKLIAREMNLTEGTVKIHVKAILSKLNAETRINAAVIALEYGIGTNLGV